ncbi:PREDICTED: hepatic lectin-like, partial [Nanorana parkeri]|uniref:hepatic lectin-like n=1 Tax=Nanorana parkeri TaxID=125878 RepID=UPI0008546F1B
SALSSEMERLESTFKKKECKDGWIQFENSCYYISKSKFEWTAARTMCQGKESDLIVINSDKEQVFFAGKINPSSFKRYWLGLHDTHKEGLWKWVDGTNYWTSYKAWTKGEPNDNAGEEDCALMWTNGEWNDVPCTYDNSYAICEQPL